MRNEKQQVILASIVLDKTWTKIGRHQWSQKNCVLIKYHKVHIVISDAAKVTVSPI